MGFLIDTPEFFPIQQESQRLLFSMSQDNFIHPEHIFPAP